MEPEVHQWYDEGQPIGPAHWLTKVHILQKLVRERNLQVYIETGTYCGDTLRKMVPHVREAHGIELSHQYCDVTLRKLAEPPGFHAVVWQGDSTEMLPQVLSTVKDPALIFLDAHFMGGDTALGPDYTPILAELTAIAETPYKHVIVIDDIEEFRNNPEYPRLEVVTEMALELFPSYGQAFVANELILAETP